MANNYSLFSEVIGGLTPEEREWVETVLGIDPDDCEPEEWDECVGKLEKLLSLDERADVDFECWPNFRWKIEGSGFGAKVEHELWLYSEEGYDGGQVAAFVQGFIRRFRPDFIFSMTCSETCSKPRVGEFGGGWMVVSKDEVLGGNTWQAAEAHAEALRTGNAGPEIEDD